MTQNADTMNRAFEEIVRLRLATDGGSLAKRADRMWEISMEMIGSPVPGAKRFSDQVAEVAR